MKIDIFQAVFALALFSLLFPRKVYGQEISPDVQPAPLVRLTGQLEADRPSIVSSFPLVRVWIGEQSYFFRMSRAESIITAYRVEEHLKDASALGLRFLANDTTLTELRHAAQTGQSIIVEGWLSAKPGILRVRSVRQIEIPSQ
jgi:hypothetical protein